MAKNTLFSYALRQYEMAAGLYTPHPHVYEPRPGERSLELADFFRAWAAHPAGDPEPLVLSAGGEHPHQPFGLFVIGMKPVLLPDETLCHAEDAKRAKGVVGYYERPNWVGHGSLPVDSHDEARLLVYFVVETATAAKSPVIRFSSPRS
jgi:hypothetical protein